MKKIYVAILLMAFSTVANAQSGTNSPYSQYGLGVLSDQTSGFNRGMNGLGLGFREHNQVNYINPASYSSIDSLTFIFDVGMSGQLTNFSENGIKKNAKNADFEYAIAGFRLFRHVGMSFGIIPFTNVGYQYANSDYINSDNSVYNTNTYSGSGGIHEIYLGIGWEPIRNVSIGINGGYLWGDYEKTVANTYSVSTINTLYKYYTLNVHSYHLTAGIQYTLPLNKVNSVTLGATYTLGHKLGAKPQCQITSKNSSTSVEYSTVYTANQEVEIPHIYNAGIMWNYNNQLRVGADYSLQQWAKTSFPVYRVTNDVPSYMMDNDYFEDRHKITVGGEYCKGERHRKFFNRLRYRAGVSYTSPYFRVNGSDGPREISVSAGFGIPIINAYNDRSILNVSGQWINMKGTGLVTENTFRINIGITFNESWFSKWKVR